MRRDRRLVVAVALAVAAAAIALVVWGTATVALVFSALEPGQAQAAADTLGPHAPIAVLTGLMLLGGVAFVAQALYRHWVAAPAKLLEQAQALVGSDLERELDASGSAETRGLARVIEALARQRRELGRDVAAQVAEASRGVERERSRLAALMSELSQSVVVCNLDGRILLYISRARLQFRALSEAPGLADGAELIGLGRSIYAVFDRKLVAHALASVRQRIERGAANPAAQFVTTTRAGQLLRVQMAPVRDVVADSGPDGATARAGSQPDGESAGPRPFALSGFVLVLENVTRDFEQQSERDALLHAMTEGSRGSLANLRAAVEILDDPELDAQARERFIGVVRSEAEAMTRRVEELAARSANGLVTRWPLEEMLGADLLAAARHRIESQLGTRCRIDEVDATLWLRVDSFSLIQALVHLAGRLAEDHEVRDLRLNLAAAEGRRAHLDLAWFGRAMSTETVTSWETDPIRVGKEASPLTVRDVVRRHDGEFWFQRERARQMAFLRFLLPLADERAGLDSEVFVRSESRPEFYDFDLFRTTEATSALDDSRLADLAFTVFDTETTGLDPTGGDEIIQIGAVRVLNGRLLRAESFEQLIDPKRGIPKASIPIHGIQPEMVAGQPTIGEVLPAFHAYAQDTVLVAHNAAFDMRFLQLKEEATGVRFEQPVLDTLLLSAVAQPNQESHKLEAIAERFGVEVIGRHTALGDAIVTAEVLVRLIPLLREKGIETLGQARAAAQKTYYARFSY